MFVCFFYAFFAIALLTQLQAAENEKKVKDFFSFGENNTALLSFLFAEPVSQFSPTTPAASRAHTQSHERLKSGERLNVRKLMDSSAAAKPFSCCCSNLTRQMGSFRELSYSVCRRKTEFSKEEAPFGKNKQTNNQNTKKGDWTFPHCPRSSSTMSINLARGCLIRLAWRHLAASRQQHAKYFFFVK